MQNLEERRPPAAGRVPGRWPPALVPARAAALAAAGFAVVSVAVGWQQISEPGSCESGVWGCGRHPAAQGWGVAGTALLAVLMVNGLRSAGSGPATPGGRWRPDRTAAGAAALLALAVVLTVTTRTWASSQPLPGFGSAAAVVSVIAAAAAGALALWARLAWPAVRRVVFGTGVAAALIAAGLTATVATAGWSQLSVTATTTAAVPAPAGQVAAAPSRLLWARPVQLNGLSGYAIAGGLVIQEVGTGDRDGVQAVDVATGKVRWQYLRADQGFAPTVLMSPQAVALFGDGLPVVYLNAATGRPQPLTRRLVSEPATGQVGQALLGSTYVQARGFAGHGEVAATSAVTGQRRWADRVADCPVFTPGPLPEPDAEPAIAQAGPVTAVIYGCQPSSSGDFTLRLGLFGPGGSQRSLTLGEFGPAIAANLMADTWLVTSGDTVLVQAPVPGSSTARQELAVSATTGAVAWRKQNTVVEAIAGSGQVILTDFSSCGRYSAASGRLLAAYPARTCALLDVPVPVVTTAGGGRLYLPVVKTARAPASAAGPARTRVDLKLTTVDVSDGAILATRDIRLPASAALWGSAVAHPDGNALVVTGDSGALAVR